MLRSSFLIGARAAQFNVRNPSLALKPTISHGVHPQDVLRKLSKEFHAFVDLNRLTHETYTVLAFPGMRGESTSIVDSNVLSKALDKCHENSETVIAVAHNFTREARDLLNEHHAIYFFKSDFYWSDESWRNIRDKR